jgi:hypothetical protein
VHPSPASIAAILLLVAALSLVVLTAVTLRPRTVTTQQLAPGSKPRVHERDPTARRTERRGAGRRTARPAARSTPTPAPERASAPPVLPPEADVPPEQKAPAPPQEAAVTPPPPATVVESFYRALDAGRFDAAWTILTPAVRSAFGGFERWRDGYATTLSNSPRDMEVAREGAVVTVAHELVTEDRSPCGPVERSYRIRWRLVQTGAGWRAASLEGVKRSGPEPAEACTARHDAAGGAGAR